MGAFLLGARLRGGRGLFVSGPRRGFEPHHGLRPHLAALYDAALVPEGQGFAAESPGAVGDEVRDVSPGVLRLVVFTAVVVLREAPLALGQRAFRPPVRAVVIERGVGRASFPRGGAIGRVVKGAPVLLPLSTVVGIALHLPSHRTMLLPGISLGRRPAFPSQTIQKRITLADPLVLRKVGIGGLAFLWDFGFYVSPSP